MRPPVRPPQLRCVFFSSMYLPHLLVLPATFWTSVPFATLSVFPSLICGSCPSGQRFAYSFFQIPSHGGHPCCSAMCFVVAYAHLGLSPIRKRPCWANKTGVRRSFSRPGACSYVTILPVSAPLPPIQTIQALTAVYLIRLFPCNITGHTQNAEPDGRPQGTVFPRPGPRPFFCKIPLLGGW